jgi:hypothetical protein
MKLSNLARQPNQFFGSALLAVTLFGFLFPHRISQTTPHYRVHMIKQSQTDTSDIGSLYTPPDSPGSHRDFGS